jgi:hypothetical protein
MIAGSGTGELLAREADGRRVDDRHHLVDVVDHHLVEQRLVAVLQRFEQHVAVQGLLQLAQILEDAPLLLLLAGDVRRQQAAQAELVALGIGEGGALVQGRITQQRDAGQAGE